MNALFAEPRGRNWYIADKAMIDVTGELFRSKAEAVAAIRAMQPPGPR
jgi:hypothetical protein